MLVLRLTSGELAGLSEGEGGQLLAGMGRCHFQRQIRALGTNMLPAVRYLSGKPVLTLGKGLCDAGRIPKALQAGLGVRVSSQKPFPNCEPRVA